MKVLHASAEQRRERRDALRAGQLFIVDLISDRPAFKTRGIVLNISKGGMAIQTFRPLVQGSVAELRLSFPQISLSSMGASVVGWQKQGGLAGIRFLDAPLKKELRQRVLRDFSYSDCDSAPLFAFRSNSSTNEFDTTLHLFACSAMVLTGATGAAIALGDSGGMECRASVGSAPEVSARLHPDIGISGHSLRTGAVNLCDDAWTDSRVNTAAARQIGARSIVIVPIMAENVVGLLEVFSGDTDHFDQRHVQQLLSLANLLAAAPELETVPQDTNSTGYDETVVPEEPTATNLMACPRLANRSRAIAIKVGAMAALLVIIVAIAWFTARVRTKPLGNSTFSISTQNDARQSNADVAAQSAESNATPEIGFNPPVIEQKVGTTFGVDVVLKGAKDVLSVPAQILYDPEELQLITVTKGSLLDSDGQAAALVQRADPLDGRINVSISRPSSAPGISGDGVVFTLVFLSKASGRSRLRVNQTGLRDTSEKILFVDSSEAMITISESTIPAKNESSGR